jgi:hypothetical protein
LKINSNYNIVFLDTVIEFYRMAAASLLKMVKLLAVIDILKELWFHSYLIELKYLDLLIYLGSRKAKNIINDQQKPYMKPKTTDIMHFSYNYTSF